MPFVTTWIDLEGIMLSEVSLRKMEYPMISHVESKKAKNQTHTESRVVVARGREWEVAEISESGQKYIPPLQSTEAHDVVNVQYGD